MTEEKSRAKATPADVSHRCAQFQNLSCQLPIVRHGRIVPHILHPGPSEKTPGRCRHPRLRAASAMRSRSGGRTYDAFPTDEPFRGSRCRHRPLHLPHRDHHTVERNDLAARLSLQRKKKTWGSNRDRVSPKWERRCMSWRHPGSHVKRSERPVMGPGRLNSDP